MANFTERIKIVVDVVTDSAKSGLNNFKTAVSQAETTTGKFKAGAGAAFDTIKESAGALALGAGSALVAYGIKAVGVFDETAKHAEDMAAATGLSVDQASRWIAIADDLGVSAESIQGSFGKIIKGLDAAAWDKYGISTHDAGGKIKDTNEIMLEAFDTLSKIPPGSARAKAGTDLFGKSYKDLAPLIGKSRQEMEKYLGSVEKGQVITDEEAKKSKDMRLAMDDLHDSLQEVTLAVGQMVAGAAPAVEDLAKVVTKVLELKSALDGITAGGPFEGFFGSIFDNFKGVANAFTDMKDQISDVVKYGPFTPEEEIKRQKFADHMKNVVVPSIDDLDRAHKTAKVSGDELVDSEVEAANKALAYSIQVDKTSGEVKRDIDAMKAKWDELTGELDREQSWINIQQQVQAVKDAVTDVGKAEKEHGPGSPEAVAARQNAQLQVIDLKQKVIDYGKEVDGLPPDKVTDLLAQIDQGNFDATLQEMDRQLLNHTFRINAHLDSIIVDGETHAAGSTTVTTGNTKVTIGTANPNIRASGGHVEPGVPYTVGEYNPETFVPDVPGTILPYAGGGNTTIINHWPPGVNPESVAVAQRRYHRRGGR